MELADLPQVMEVDAASLPQPWSARIWHEELHSPFSRCLLLADGSLILGYIVVKLIAEDLHIMTIAVRLEHRRLGYARVLVEAALAEHTAAAIVYLEVRPGNTAARALYESLGFYATGVRPRYYGNEDAVLMTLNLRGSATPSAAGPAPPSGAETPPGSRRA
jgi:ribosomal-protein-alanine N-acetyltransferase